MESKIQDALSDAEALKLQVSTSPTITTHTPSLTKQKSFQALSNAITAALQFAASATTRTQNAKVSEKSPTHATTTSVTVRQPTLSQTSTNLRREKNDMAPSAVSAQHSEIRQTILSEFLMIPSNVPKTTWDQIAGLANVKRSLQETAILPLLRPDLFTGLRRPQNILLYGPPGTGKTLLVKAVAYESQSNLFVCTSSAVTSKWMGEAEKLVRELFAMAQALVPSIVFLDEVDALLSSRKESDHEASRRLKTEFMVQMDGIRSQSNDDQQQQQQQQQQHSQHVLVIACTNCPWDVDSAILRRFPRRILVPLPDAQARSGLIEYLLKKIGKHSITSTRQLTRLVNLTEGFSGSDITAIASEASFGPQRELGHLDAMKGCKAEDLRPVVLNDFESVLANTTKSVDASLLERYDQWKQQQQ
jgi:SpoVK/Ycf46/Vps4 family AAA+-type ATPase